MTKENELLHRVRRGGQSSNTNIEDHYAARKYNSVIAPIVICGKVSFCTKGKNYAFVEPSEKL